MSKAGKGNKTYKKEFQVATTPIITGKNITFTKRTSVKEAARFLAGKSTVPMKIEQVIEATAPKAKGRGSRGGKSHIYVLKATRRICASKGGRGSHIGAGRGSKGVKCQSWHEDYPNWATPYNTRKRKYWCRKGGYKINGKGVKSNKGQKCHTWMKR